MLISYEWLQDFVSFKGKKNADTSPEAVATQLTRSTVEVEEVIELGVHLKHIVVGQVTKIEKHPDADMLQICHVDDGKIIAQVVCGGSNLKQGMKVAFGKIGAKVRWHGEGELVELQKVKIRGVESHGMICASDEIGLGAQFPKKSEKEILDLSQIDCTPGQSLAAVLGLGGFVLDIDNKSLSNRPDLWGHYGIAREVAALYDIPLQEFEKKKIPAGKQSTFVVHIKDNRCKRYMAVMVDGIDMVQSPAWMQQRLLAVGVRPINVVVDITNYVMYELGQPTHAFDATKIDGDIAVRAAKHGETLDVLGDKTCELKGDLVIADKHKALAVAGVIGGANSEIDNNTTTVIFESANFEGISVRRTANALGIRTDSSTRFEKQLDPTLCEIALMRAVSLLREICPQARVASPVVDVGTWSLDQGPIVISPEMVAKKVGVDIAQKNIVLLLSRLGFLIKEKKDVLEVTVPSWRATGDISIAEDLIEEIIRLYGYENIPASFPSFSIEPPPVIPERRLTWHCKEMLAYEYGFTEVYNYSFVSPDWLARIGIDAKKHIELENPIAKDRPLVRRSLIPNLLENIERNVHRFDTVKIFEVGKVYTIEEDGEIAVPGKKMRLPAQDTMLSMVYAKKKVDAPLHELVDAIRHICTVSGVPLAIQQKKPKEDYLHPGRYAVLCADDVEFGFVGEIHPAVQERLGIPYRTAVASIHMPTFVMSSTEEMDYSPIPLYPASERDIAMILDRTAVHDEIQEEILSVDDLIVGVELFDVYTGTGIDEGKKSMGYRITYRSDERTLDAREVDEIHKTVLERLEKKFHAEVRK